MAEAIALSGRSKMKCKTTLWLSAIHITEAVKLEEGGGDEAASGLNEADLAEDPIMKINFTVRVNSRIHVALLSKDSADAPSLRLTLWSSFARVQRKTSIISQPLRTSSLQRNSWF